MSGAEANRIGQSGPTPRPEGWIDPRGPRFVAGITSALLLIGVFLALIGNSSRPELSAVTLAERAADPGFVLLAIVAVLFAWSLVSSGTQPWAVVFRRAIQPRLAPPAEWEDPRPPRFAQGVGLVVVGAGLLLHLIGVPWALVIAGSAAFLAAVLNAGIGFCLGCEVYLLLVRARPARG